MRPHGLKPPRLLCPWNSPGKNTLMGCHFLLQGTFPTHRSNLGPLHYRQILYQMSYQGNIGNSKCKMIPSILDVKCRVSVLELIWRPFSTPEPTSRSQNSSIHFYLNVIQVYNCGGQGLFALPEFPEQQLFFPLARCTRRPPPPCPTKQ